MVILKWPQTTCAHFIPKIFPQTQTKMIKFDRQREEVMVILTENNDEENSLRDHILQECEAMAKYAFSSGLKVPTSVVKTLESFRLSESGEKRKMDGSDLRATGRESETSNMGRSQNLPENDIEHLSQVHVKLAKIVAPATPRTILLLQTEKGGLLSFLGPIKLIQHMMFASILFLVAFIAIGQMEEVQGAIDLNDYGRGMLLNELFLISAAGIGATFSGLFQANRYVVEGNFDPKYEASYWIRLILGITAGLILAMLVPFDISDVDTSMKIEQPLLALLGGFSAPVVYRILTRLIETVESFLRGDTRDLIANREQEAKAHFAEQLAQNRLKTASNLVKLQKQFGTDISPDELNKMLDQILNDLIPTDSYEDEIEKNKAPEH